MYIFSFFIVVLWTCQIKGDNIKFVNIDLNTKKSTNYLQVKKIQSGDIIKYNITTKSDCRCQKVKDNEHMIYEPYESEVFKGVNVLYFKGVNEPTIVEIIYENNHTYNVTNYNYYIRYHHVGWKRSLRDFYKVDFKILLTNIYEGNFNLKCPKFLDLDLNNRTSNEAVDVKCSNVGDTWTFRFFPRQGYVILLVTAKGGIIWQLTGCYLMPSEVKLSISNDTLVSLTFKDPKGKSAPATITYRIHPGTSKDTVSGHDDIDITKKATLISSTDVDDEEERDEQGVIEDPTEWIGGIEVSEEEMKQLSELQEQKPQDVRVDKEVIEPEADLREAEGELIEEGATPSGEDIEHEVEIEEMEEEEEILPDYHLDDYFKDLKPITLDIYNHETEGLEVKVKSYPKYSSTIYTCIPNDGYILDSVYDSQRNETVWRKYKHDKYAVAALVDANYLELIVIFVIDVNPNKSKVLYYRNLPSYGWRERYRESLDQCYLDTIIKGEWRISEKVL